MERIDLMIQGGVVVTMNPRKEIIENGAVAIQGERIRAVDSRDALAARFAPAEIIDSTGCAVIPGLINAHTHAPMTLLRGLADDLPLMEWLEGYIFPVEAHLTAERVRWGARLACAEMLLGGTTTFCDMYLFEEEVAQAAREAGMRAVVGEVLYDFPSPNYGPLEEGFRYTEELICRWRGDALVNIAVKPHAPFTCSPELLKRARDLANEHHVPLIIHLSETKDEIDRIQEQYGVTPVRHLDRLGIFDGHTIAAHVVWVDEEELNILKDNDVGVVHNPESNMKLVSGVAPVPRMLEMGIAVGLGTDGCASNNDLDLFGEMDTTAKLHKVQGLDPTVMDARTVLEMATILGARVLGLEDRVGSLEPGKRADLVILDLHQPHLSPMFHVESHLIYAARASDVRTVIVNGDVVVGERTLRTLSFAEIQDAVREIAAEIVAIVQAAKGSEPGL